MKTYKTCRTCDQNFHIILKTLNILGYSNETLSAEKLIL